MERTANSGRAWVFRAMLALCLLALFALMGWVLSKRQTDHWQEVAKARYYLDHGRPDRAFEAVSGIRDANPGAAEGLTLAARSLLLQGGISPAKRALEHSLKLKPDQPEAAKMLAAVYLASGDGLGGLDQLKRAAELDPHDFRPWYAMGKVYHDLGAFDKSAASYADALRRSPPEGEAKESRIGRIRALLEGHHPELAADDLEILRAGTPEDAELLALAARQALDSGRTEAALALAERVLARDPHDLDSLLTRARVRSLTRQPKAALGDLTEAIKLNPHNIGALQLLTQTQRQLGMDKEAAASQAQADKERARTALMDKLAWTITNHPEDPRPRLLMGQAAMEGEMFTLANACFQAALDLDPTFQPAREALESLRSRKGFDHQAAVGPQLQLPGMTRLLGR
jgi:cytochrome c-type biogenesis protein CcmH/NrfG